MVIYLQARTLSLLSVIRLVAAVSTFASVLLLGGCYNAASEYEALIRNAETIEAHISSKNCRNHAAVAYKFTLDGKSHHGSVPWGLVSCESAQIGDPLKVYYDPQHPEVHTPLTPADAYRMAKGYYFPDWAFALLVIPLVVVGQILITLKAAKHKR